MVGDLAVTIRLDQPNAARPFVKVAYRTPSRHWRGASRAPFAPRLSGGPAVYTDIPGVVPGRTLRYRLPGAIWRPAGLCTTAGNAPSTDRALDVLPKRSTAAQRS